MLCRIVSILDSNNLNIITDSSDKNGHIIITIQKSNDMIYLKTSFNQCPERCEFYKNSFPLKPDKNYKIIIYTTQKEGFDSETIYYTIKNIRDKSYVLIKYVFGKRLKIY